MKIDKILKLFIPKEISFFTKALTLLFVIAGIFGFVVAQQFPAETLAAIKEAADKLAFINSMSPIQIFFMIFLNNAIKVFFMMLLGVAFGIIPVVFILLNGYIVGVVISVMLAKVGIFATLIGLLPHGIFEIFAVIIAGGYGVYLGEIFVKKLRKRDTFIPHFKIVFYKYFYIILPIILLSAIVETFFTSKLLTSFLM